MGRRKTFDSSTYVIYDKNTDKSKCLLCGKMLNGNITSNIKRHYRNIHLYNLEYCKDIEASTLNGMQRTNSKKINKISIDMDKNEFLRCCVGLVTVKNMPFRIFDDNEFFKKIVSPYEELFHININSKNIVAKLNIAAKKLKVIISKSVSKKMVCLKVDVATRLDKSILGINIQHIDDGKIVIHTIGMIQLRKRHTAQFLKEEIMKCLEEYNIDITQLYSCTSDNGANVIKTSKLLQDLQEDMQGHLYEDEISDDEEYVEIHSELTSVLAVVRCAAHTIQLAAHDVLSTIKIKVDECRAVVKTLRTLIKNENHLNVPMPPIDNITRWNSTFKMLNALKNLRDYVDNMVECNLPEVDWTFINNFLIAFKPISECTMKFQYEQYIIGDFYRDWMCCEIELEDIRDQGNVYATQLAEAMKKRKINLLANDAFVAAIYLDPRFNFVKTPFLTEEQKKSAMRHLLKTQTNIKRLSGEFETENFMISTPPQRFSTCYSRLQEKMNLMIEQAPTTDHTTKQKLENICNAERISFETNILEHYKNKKYQDSELDQLIKVALAVPSTQVSVERAFSALSLILTKFRAKLSKETINNMLLIKLNYKFMENVIINDEDNN